MQQCIDSGVVNSYTIASSQISSSILKEGIVENKLSYVPSLNGGMTHGYNWGQTLDPFTNQFASQRVQYNNFYLRSSVSLFSGMSTRHNLSLLRIDLEQEEYNRILAERNLKIDISTAYLQVLVNNEVLEIALDHVDLSKNEQSKMKLLVEAEKETEYQLLEINSQVERDRLTVVSAQNDLNYALLNLQQLMNIPYDASFNIVTADKVLDHSITPYNKMDLDRFVEVRMDELSIERLSINEKLLRSSLYPSLTLNGSMGTGYSGNSTIVVNGVPETKPFGLQFSDNFYQSAFLSLQIPIFNQRATKTQLKINELQTQQSALDKAQSKNVIKGEYERLKMEVSNSQREFEMVESLLSLVKLNYEQAQAQFENGKISFSDLQEIKNQLFVAESDVIQAKYQSDMNQLILKFYAEN
ncbi:TolC family protein [bacterium]|nr:TolC family protein [bacterium]